MIVTSYFSICLVVSHAKHIARITFDWNVTSCKTIKLLWLIDWWSSRIQSPRVRCHYSSACLSAVGEEEVPGDRHRPPVPHHFLLPDQLHREGPSAVWEHRLLAKWHTHIFPGRTAPPPAPPPFALLDVCLWVLRNPSRNRCPTTARRNYCTCGRPFCTC